MRIIYKELRTLQKQILKVIWDFFQNQILGMKWLDAGIRSGLSALGLDTSSRLIGSIEIFSTT
jgi:hypothetical protein